MHGLYGKGGREVRCGHVRLAGEPELHPGRRDPDADARGSGRSGGGAEELGGGSPCADQDPRIGCPERPCATQEIDRLEEGGLARAIAAGEDVQPRAEGEFRGLDAAEVRDPQVCERQGNGARRRLRAASA
jgi:hypothetical protein